MSKTLLSRLQTLAVSRDTKTLLSDIAKHAAQFRALRPTDPALPSVIAIVSQAIYFGYHDLKLLTFLLRKLPESRRSMYKHPDLDCFSLGEAVLAIFNFEYVRAQSWLKRVAAYEYYLPEPLQVFALQLRSKLYRKNGQYDRALGVIVKAGSVANKAQLRAVGADLKVDEAWLKFQLKRYTEARHLLDKAEPVLRVAGDSRRVGDIFSARTRIEQRLGSLREAENYCEAALPQYEDSSAIHRGIPRTLVNLAKIIWLQVRQRTRPPRDLAVALDLLDRAGRLCDEHGYGGSRVRVLYIRAYVLADASRTSPDSAAALKEAAMNAEAIINIGRERRNPLWQARGKALLAMLPIRALELAIPLFGSPDETAALAIRHGLEGLSILKTGAVVDSRIRVKLHTSLAFAHLYRRSRNLRQAEKSLQVISQLLDDMIGDYVTDDAVRLRQVYASAEQESNADLRALLALTDRESLPYDILAARFKDIVTLRMLRKHNWEVKPVAGILHLRPEYVRQTKRRHVVTAARRSVSKDPLGPPERDPCGIN